MSTQYPGGFISKSPTLPNGSTAGGIWTLNQQAASRKANLWPTTPKAPTSPVASVVTATTASVSFVAPADIGSSAITSYTVTSNPENITASGATSPITVTGLTTNTAYTFTVTATNGAGTGPASVASNSVTPVVLQGQQVYATPGTYSWTAPAGVTSICVVCVGGGGAGDDGNTGDGGGGGGGGGGLAFANNVPVTPGQSYTVVVGAGGTSGNGYNTRAQSGDASYITIGSFQMSAFGGQGGAPYSTSPGANGGTNSFVSTPGGVTTGGGAGGGGGAGYNGGAGGGGAGGYNGNGGSGMASISGYGLYTSGFNGSGTGSGGGGGTYTTAGTGNGGGNGGSGQNDTTGGGGGGANIYSSTNPTTNGGNGNGLSSSGSKGGNGGFPGGGGGGSWDNGTGLPAAGGSGAVRIIWGAGRSFPNNATDV